VTRNFHRVLRRCAAAAGLGRTPGSRRSTSRCPTTPRRTPTSATATRTRPHGVAPRQPTGGLPCRLQLPDASCRLATPVSVADGRDRRCVPLTESSELRACALRWSPSHRQDGIGTLTGLSPGQPSAKSPQLTPSPDPRPQTPTPGWPPVQVPPRTQTQRTAGYFCDLRFCCIRVNSWPRRVPPSYAARGSVRPLTLVFTTLLGWGSCRPCRHEPSTNTVGRCQRGLEGHAGPTVDTGCYVSGTRVIGRKDQRPALVRSRAHPRVGKIALRQPAQPVVAKPRGGELLSVAASATVHDPDEIPTRFLSPSAPGSTSTGKHRARSRPLGFPAGPLMHRGTSADVIPAGV